MGLTKLKATSITVFVLILSGMLLRIRGIFNDLWLDEIWSLLIIRDVFKSPLDAFSYAESENIHPLYAFFMTLLDPASALWIYRVPSLLFALGTLLLGWQIARRLRTAAGIIFIALLSLSYVMILYGSEARGYSAMLFFTLAAWITGCAYLDGKSQGAAVLFGLSVVGGALSHYGFVIFYISFALWSIGRSTGSFFDGRFCAASSWRIAKDMAVLHLLPLAFLAWLWWSHIRILRPPTGNIYSVLDLIVNIPCLAFLGFQVSANALPQTLFLLLFAVGIFFITAWEMLNLKREGSVLWGFGLLLFFAVPICICIVLQRDVLSPRYFLCTVPFAFLLAASGLLRLWSAGRVPRILAVLFLSAIFAGNAMRVCSFMQHGRGEYRKGLDYIISHSVTEGLPISVGSSFDFRNNMVIEFYRDLVPGAEKIEYVEKEAANARPVMWYIRSSQDMNESWPNEFSMGNGVRYGLQAVFPFVAESGWAWVLYRKKDT